MTLGLQGRTPSPGYSNELWPGIYLVLNPLGCSSPIATNQSLGQSVNSGAPSSHGTEVWPWHYQALSRAALAQPQACRPPPQEKERNARRKKKKGPGGPSEEAAFPPVVEEEEMEASGTSGNEEEAPEDAEGRKLGVGRAGW